MIIDYDRFTPDETRDSLLLAKELLRNMIQRAETDEAAKMYSHAYTSLCDAIAAFDRETEAEAQGAPENA